MNVYLRELRAHRKSLIVWSVVMTAFMYLSMGKYAALSVDAAASQQLMKAFPETLQAVFGMTGLNLTAIEGYYGICFIFIAVMLAIHAGQLGAELLAKEEIDKTAEFLYVKPVARLRVFAMKLLAGTSIMLVLAAVTALVTYTSIASVNHGSVPVHILAVFTAGLAVIQLLFFAIGVLMAAIATYPKRAGALVAGLVSAAYIGYVLQGMSSNFAWLKNISPFAYFNAKDIIATNSLDNRYIWLSIIVAIFSVIMAAVIYKKRDLNT